MTPDIHRQILLSYWRKAIHFRFMFGYFAFLAVVALGIPLIANLFMDSIAGRHVGQHASDGSLLSVIHLNGWWIWGSPVLIFLALSTGVICHLREQLESTYATLAPRFREPQIRVASVMIGLFFFAGSLCLSQLLWIPLYTAMSLLTPLGAAWLWLNFRFKRLYAPFTGLIFFYPIIPSIIPEPARTISNQLNLMPTGFFILLLGAGLFGLFRLFIDVNSFRAKTADESTPLAPAAFTTPTPFNIPSNALAPKSFNSWFSQLFLVPRDGQFKPIPDGPTGYWARIRRARIALCQTNTFPKMIVYYLMFELTNVVISYLMLGPRLMFSGHGTPSYFLGVFLIMQPTMQGPFQTCSLELELLRPRSRRDFLAERLTVIVLGMLESWFALATVYALDAVIFSRQWLANGDFATMILEILLIGILGQAVHLWCLPMRSGPTWNQTRQLPSIIMALCMPMMMLLCPPYMAGKPSIAQFILVDAAILMVSFIIFLDARRRWLKAELG